MHAEGVYNYYFDNLVKVKKLETKITSIYKFQFILLDILTKVNKNVKSALS